MHWTTITAPNAGEGSLPDPYLPVYRRLPAWIFKNCGFYGHSQNPFDQFSHFDCLPKGSEVIYSVSRKTVRGRLLFTHERTFSCLERVDEVLGWTRILSLSPRWPLSRKKPVMDKAQLCCAVMTWYDDCLHVRTFRCTRTRPWEPGRSKVD